MILKYSYINADNDLKKYLFLLPQELSMAKSKRPMNPNLTQVFSKGNGFLKFRKYLG